MNVSKKKYKRWFSLICLWLTLIVGSGLVLAEENGGSVKTEGVITFYEETTASSNEKNHVTAPGKLLPQTDGASHYRESLAGLAIVTMTTAVYHRKRRCREVVE